MNQQADPWAKYRGQPAQGSPTPAPTQSRYPGVIQGAPTPPKPNEVLARDRFRYDRERDEKQDAKKEEDRERGEPIGDSLYEKTEAELSTLTALRRGLDGFIDDYAGNTLTGGLENTVQSLVNVGTPGQREWWADFRQTDNLIRNKLFGSALSAQEKAAYEETTVSPSMRPEIVKANLARRAGIIQKALTRRRDFLLANGYRKEAVGVLFSPLAQMEVNEKADRDSPTPPRFRAGDGNVVGVTRDFGGSNEKLATAEGDEVREDNPALKGVRDEYHRRLAEGQSAQEIIKWARAVGIDSSAYRSIADQVKFRKENPSVPINQYDTTQLDDQAVKLSGLEQTLNDVASSPAGAALIGAGEGASAFMLDELVGATGGNTERARLAMDIVARENLVPHTLGTIAGGVTTALTGEAALAARGVKAGLGRAVAADGAFGAAAGSGMADDGSRLAGAATGLTAATAGSFVGNKAGNALARAASPARNESVRAMNEIAVPLTPGQQYSQSGQIGQAIKGLEDRAMDVPIVGEVIKQRRFEGYERFNSKAFDHALKPIGGEVSGKTGAAAVEDAQAQVSKAFSDALSGKGVLPDAQFGKDLTAAVTKAKKTPRMGDELVYQIGEVLDPYKDMQMLSGEALQDISRSLRDIKHRYRNDPLVRPIHRNVDAVERSIFDLFDRQASGTVEEYNKARAAYRRLSVLEDAVLRAKNSDGVFTTGQLGLADRTNSKRFDGRRGAASGRGVFHDMHQAGQEVLPSQVPNSGTAGRLLLPLAGATIIGGDAVDGDVGLASLTIGAVLAGAYSKAGQRLITAPGRGSDNAVSRTIADQRTKRAISATGGAAATGSTNALLGPR